MSAPSLFGPNAPRRQQPFDSPASSTTLLPGGNTFPHSTSVPRSGPNATGSPYSAASGFESKASLTGSMSDKFSLPPDPMMWGASNLSRDVQEPDDYLHNPDPRRDRRRDRGGTIFTARGFYNLGFLFLLVLGMMGLFAGYPMAMWLTSSLQSSNGGFNLGGINGSGQVPEMNGNWGAIDLDTPEDVKTKKGPTNNDDLVLVFSDEFNVDGRTFYPGDDPYWEAVDLHYWGTNNMEWYDPKAITTQDGALRVTLSAEPNHDLDYTGGMMSTWNKFCFTGGLVEVAVTLPGTNNIVGLWPAVWTMGNLGRAGYGASLDGTWPYTYDSCDVGTVANQTKNGLPTNALIDGDASYDDVLSYQGGQRLSRCTCPGEIHPGPMHSDGTYVGRAAPEIDIFEAQVSTTDGGHVSQSCQWAPYNYGYQWFNTSDNLIIYDDATTQLNSYMGGVYQQATSAVSKTDQDCYELETGCFAVYGFEYVPGFDNSYITWINNNEKAWTMTGDGMAADTRVEIGPRPIPEEPLYLIINLGMSRNFGDVDLDHLTFPTTMSIDWVRVYQKSDSVNLGCDPPEFPTAAYIAQFPEAYSNPNLTTWVDDYKQTVPKNSFLDEC
ncbi:beta-glucan synthesis-associated protein [Schizophyllum amplum]|uniref:Beta-glucan synthesis-associated protein n=1 Tax=Schizophyllum amplum TaxID=97359 RepID=A0A550CNP0_9AGAR|nr:beta-glucan synthesis-associated protein [Auriculariopsis ampla]